MSEKRRIVPIRSPKHPGAIFIASRVLGAPYSDTQFICKVYPSDDAEKVARDIRSMLRKEMSDKA